MKMTTLSVYMRALSLSKILKSQYPSVFTLYRDHTDIREFVDQPMPHSPVFVRAKTKLKKKGLSSQCHKALCLCEQKKVKKNKILSSQCHTAPCLCEHRGSASPPSLRLRACMCVCVCDRECVCVSVPVCVYVFSRSLCYLF